MPSNPTTRQLFIWIACLAVLLNALVPSVSHAVAAGRAAPASREICRADPTASVPRLAAHLAPAAAHKAGHDGGALLQDCGYCVAHAGSQGLLPAITAGLGMLGGHALRPVLSYHAPRPLLALAAAAPRGPPARA
jgi:hypothetical protein